MHVCIKMALFSKSCELDTNTGKFIYKTQNGVGYLNVVESSAPFPIAYSINKVFLSVRLSELSMPRRGYLYFI